MSRFELGRLPLRASMTLRLLALLCLALSAAASPASFHRSFPGVAILTSFAHDYGDRIDSISYQGEVYRDIATATAELLPKFGWDNPEERIRLGTTWADEVVLFGSRVVETGAGRGAELLPDGTFRYTTWATSMSGRSPGSQSTRWQVEITPSAELRVTELENAPPKPQEGRLELPKREIHANSGFVCFSRELPVGGLLPSPSGPADYYPSTGQKQAAHRELPGL